MKNSVVEIQGVELESFKKDVESNPGVRSLLDALVEYEKVPSKAYNILSAKKSQVGGTNVAFMVMGLNEDKIKIVTLKTDQGYEVFASTIEEENGTEIVKGYTVENNRIKNTFTLNYDENLKEAVKKVDNLELKEPIKKDQIKVDLPCFYGNWCGPFCSGPDDPISSVDYCCKNHDNCYGSRGYFACSCDFELLDCLQPYVNQGSEVAILVYLYFLGSPCNPFI